MLAQVTVRLDGLEVGTVEREVTGSAEDLEEQVRDLVQRVGRVTLESGLIPLGQQAAAPRCCGRPMKNCGWRTITIRTTFGDLPVRRRRYHCPTCDHEQYPADSGWCCGRHRISRPLAKRVCQLATLEHYPRLPGLLADQHGVTVSSDTVMELVHDTGGPLDERRLAEAARGRRSAAALVPEITPRRMLIEVDGTMYCTNQRESSSAASSSAHLAWQQMKVGAVAWEDEQGRWQKRLVWGRESPQEFGAALYRLACRCGYEQAEEKLFAADGADWCWEIQQTFFAAATPIIDWYHVSEHVWEAARHVAGDEAADWARQALERLHEGGGTELVAWLAPQSATRRRAARAALEQLMKYLRPRVTRLNYPAYRAHGWPIGSGLIESSCRQLVGLRLKGPGMHWTEHGALAVTALRATDLNGEWHATWKTLALAT